MTQNLDTHMKYFFPDPFFTAHRWTLYDNNIFKINLEKAPHKSLSLSRAIIDRVILFFDCITRYLNGMIILHWNSNWLNI